MDETCKMKRKHNLQESGKHLQNCFAQHQFMQFHPKAVLDSLLNSLDFVFPSRFWLPLVLGFQSLNGALDSQSSIPDSKDMDSRKNNHKSCEF